MQLIVTLVYQPISFAMDVVSSLRRKFRRFFARPQDHELRVKNVQDQVKKHRILALVAADRCREL